MERMGELEKLRAENEELKKDNEMLLGIISQMRTTLNRLIAQYIEKQPED